MRAAGGRQMWGQGSADFIKWSQQPMRVRVTPTRLTRLFLDAFATLHIQSQNCLEVFCNPQIYRTYGGHGQKRTEVRTRRRHIHVACCKFASTSLDAGEKQKPPHSPSQDNLSSQCVSLTFSIQRLGQLWDPKRYLLFEIAR